MKRRLFTFVLAALTIGLLGSCSEINERIDGLDKRVYDLENGKIASIDQQIDAINRSIADLETIRTNIQNLKNEQEAQGQDITDLKAADITLEGKINDLKTYVDTELSKYATKDWANATFATLEQHQWTCDTIAKIDARIGALDAKLSQSISGLKNSLKQWVNEQLDAYYTAAQMDAKLGVMQSEIDALKNSKDSERIDSIATELTKTKVAVDSAKTNIRSEYKAAIQSAIETSEGKLTQALKDSIAKVNDKIVALDTRVTTLELKMQAVEGRVDKLEAALGAYTELQGTITEIIKKLLADVGDKPQNEQDTTIWKCITALQAQCGTFSTAIETLQGLVGSKDVATQISEAIASLISTQKLSGLADAVSALKDIVYGTGDVKSLTQQIADINTALSTTYATKTQLSQDIAAAKSELQSQIDSLCNVIGADGGTTTATGIFKKIADLNAKVAALEAVKITIESTEYTKWSDAVQAVLNKVNALGIGNISGLQDALNDLDARLDKIEAMIQSVTIVPAYSDGSVESTKDGVLYLDIIVSPAQAVAALTKDCLKVLVNEVKTRAVDVGTVAVTKFKVDAAKGTITARADISSNLPVASGKALTIAVNVRNGISDYTTEFYPVTLSSNVTVKDETDTTKVTIKADADFPEFTMGTIPVDSGFTDSKPTTITVEGIGNITFDKEATAKIKSNAQSEGATNVFFKVEDVTTTKPVTNADVVLEVTMKTVDENGIEVFSKGKAAGEVTIEIPMDENVAYVNSVTLVNDAGEPIQGGVVPGSEKIENGKLIFKVNHFSKYAIDYVTKTDFVKVTGVSLNKDTLNLEVGDTLKLVATITPEDATNKNVTWSSSNESVATVDNDGKVTAVSKGTATITVTTVDGSKTATCEVTVTVPVTGVSLNVNTLSLNAGGSHTLIATITPEDATNKNVTWSSSNESVATVDNDGKVTAVAAGTATITATTVDGSKTATCEVTVTMPVTGVSLNVNTLSLNVDDSHTLIATITPEDATNKNVTWSSSNESVATVDNDGNVTAVAAGTATITATTVDGSKTATCTVTVKAEIKTVADVLATVVGGFPNSSDQNVIPDNAWVADVPNNRKCYAYTATSGSTTALLLRIPQVGDVKGTYTFSLTSLDVTKGENCYTVSISYGNLEFNMTNGILTSFKFIPDPSKPNAANFAGTYTAPTLSGVTLDKTELSLMVGDSETLKATVQPADATNKNVIWSSDNTSVATVDNDGKVTAVAAGTATITVTTVDGAKTATCEVTVIAPNSLEKYNTEEW